MSEDWRPRPLTEVSAECRFIVQKMWEETFGTSAGVHLKEGVRLTVQVLTKKICTVTSVTLLAASLSNSTAHQKKKMSSHVPSIHLVSSFPSHNLLSLLRGDEIKNITQEDQLVEKRA